jgi:hypothetical protein
MLMIYLVLTCKKLQEATEGEQFSGFLRKYKCFGDFF